MTWTITVTISGLLLLSIYEGMEILNSPDRLFISLFNFTPFCSSDPFSKTEAIFRQKLIQWIFFSYMDYNYGKNMDHNFTEGAPIFRKTTAGPLGRSQHAGCAV